MPSPLMHELLEDAAARLGDRDAVVAGDHRWSWRDLQAASAAFSARLSERGLGPGDRVAVLMANRVEFVVAVNAISRVGAAAVMFSPAWRDTELRHALGLTSPVHAVTDEASGQALVAILGADPVTDVDATPLVPAAGDAGVGGAGGEDRATTADDEAVLVFSSGTTGLPKAVRHTHRSIVSGASHWAEVLGLTAEDRFQVATPPSHILGLLNLLAAATSGATVRLHPRFVLDTELEYIARERMTLEMAVAPIALAIANHPDLERYDLSSLRYIMWGATPVTASVAETITARTGVPILACYGASEVPLISANPVDDPGAWRLDSVGLPPADVALRVVDLDSGAVLPPGGVGELQISSPSAMAGYLPAEASAEAFADGWYRTGDVGWVEAEGWIHITDRSKEMIKVNGFQVAPAEIEGVLLRHPAVLDCAVFGVPDDTAGERPVAAVAADAGRTVTAGELEGLVAESLATYKRLREVRFVDQIPRLASGKVLRRVLRDGWEDPGPD